MGYEIDFLPVGQSKSGDAIAVRFGDLHGPSVRQSVVVIDAGYPDTGPVVVNHVRSYYKTNRIDLLISTHPDQDHVGGIEHVLSECEVGQLWMHQPWSHTDDIAKMFVDGRVTDQSITEALRKSLDEARSLERLAIRKGVPIIEPFTGLIDTSNTVLVVGPSKEYYESLLPDFRCTPETRTAPSLLEKALRSAQDIVAKVAEYFHIETLDDTGETSAENNSSTILLFALSDDCLLFTADAGMPALQQAVDWLVAAGFDFNRIKFIQVPHHGSARNVGPTLLDTLIGPKLPQDTKLRSGFVSVATLENDKHPSKKVMNAFRRRGVHILATAGGTKNHYVNAPGWPARPGWVAAPPLPFYNEVED